jgi:hypothetical protein
MMKRIKDAKENGSEELVKKRTNQLQQYLESEGLLNRFDD